MNKICIFPPYHSCLPSDKFVIPGFLHNTEMSAISHLAYGLMCRGIAPHSSHFCPLGGQVAHLGRPWIHHLTCVLSKCHTVGPYQSPPHFCALHPTPLHSAAPHSPLHTACIQNKFHIMSPYPFPPYYCTAPHSAPPHLPLYEASSKLHYR